VKLGRVARQNRDESSTLAGNLDRLSEQCAFVNDRLSGWNHALKSITQYRQREPRALPTSARYRGARPHSLANSAVGPMCRGGRRRTRRASALPASLQITNSSCASRKYRGLSRCRKRVSTFFYGPLMMHIYFGPLDPPSCSIEEE
jgi:hypothetical protein